MGSPLRPPPRPSKPTRKYLTIWKTVRRIPKGRVSTYGAIAALSGLAGQARLVGYALHNLPPKSGVPWHRVINARGMISLTDLDDMAERQKRLLRAEGVLFTKGAVSLVKFGWPKDIALPR